MAGLEYHVSPRGVPGFTVSITGVSGNTNRAVVPAFSQVDSAGNPLPAGTSADPVNSVDGGRYNVTKPTLTSGQRGDLQLNAAGALITQIGDGTSAASINFASVDNAPWQTVGALQTIANGTRWNGQNFDRDRKFSGKSRITSTATGGSPTSVKTTAADLGGFVGLCGAAATYIQVYDKASAPVIGTDTPVLTFPCPANAAFSSPSAWSGTYFTSGLAIAFTTDAAGTTAAAAAAVTSFGLTYA